MTSPLLKIALAGLSLDLEQELKRYRRDQEVALPDQLATVSQDSDLIDSLTFDLSFSPVLDPDLTPTSDQVTSDIDTQDWELSYLFDDLSNDLSTDLENTLEEEFQDQVLTREFAEISSIQTDQNSEAPAPNLLSPMGIIAMIVLLISSATVGYLWVDPSGLNRLIKSDPKPTSALPAKSIELFQTRDRKEPIPFVDFSISKPSTQALSKVIIAPFLPAIGSGRSFEEPITVQPEEKIKLEPVAAGNPKSNLTKPSDTEKPDINSKLEPTLSSPEIIPNSSLNTPSTPSPSSTPNSVVDGNISLDATRLNPIGEGIDATKPNPSVDPQIKPEVTQEVN